MHDARPAILWRVRAFYKPAPFQTVHGGCHRRTAQQHLLSKSVHRQRPFVQEGFEDTEIGQAQVFGFDAPMRWRFLRLRCLPQQQPEVNVLPLFRRLVLFGLYFSYLLHGDARYRDKLQDRSAATVLETVLVLIRESARWDGPFAGRTQILEMAGEETRTGNSIQPQNR